MIMSSTKTTVIITGRFPLSLVLVFELFLFVALAIILAFGRGSTSLYGIRGRTNLYGIGRWGNFLVPRLFCIVKILWLPPIVSDICVHSLSIRI